MSLSSGCFWLSHPAWVCGLKQVKGGIGAILVIAEERDDTYDIVDWKAVVVDGDVVKADTWYRLKNGELVEVD